MSKKTLVTILGLSVSVLPFLGMPASFSTILFVSIGLTIVYIARSGVRKK